MADDTTPREAFKEAAEAAIRANKRNIGDRGLNGPDSALFVGANREWPGLLDVLADAAEQAYGAPPKRAGRAS